MALRRRALSVTAAGLAIAAVLTSWAPPAAAEPTASLRIVHNATPDDGTAFAFTSPQLGDFTVDDETTFDALEAGQYSVTAVDTPGWDLTLAECAQETIDQAAEASSAAAAVDGRQTLTIGEGEHWVCTFGQVARVSITVRTDAQPDAAQDFAYALRDVSAGDPVEVDAFALDDDDEPTLPNERTLDVAAGTYVLAQDPVERWLLVGLECDALPGDLGDGSVRIALNPGDDVTCTFVNAGNATLTIVNQVIGLPDPARVDEFVFTIALTCGGAAQAFRITGEGTATTELPIGTTCTVTESPVTEPGEGITWRSTIAEASGEPDDAVVTMDADGETVTVVNERTQVLGGGGSRPAPNEQPRQQLPATGADTELLPIVGAALVALGALALRLRRCPRFR